jgi:hypothetical protein
MDSPMFERRVRIPVLITVYAVALAAVFVSLWISGAVIMSGLCDIFGVACPVY